MKTTQGKWGVLYGDAPKQTNVNGMTFVEWANAAGIDLDDTKTHRLWPGAFRAWQEGEDPTEHRARRASENGCNHCGGVAERTSAADFSSTEDALRHAREEGWTHSTTPSPDGFVVFRMHHVANSGYLWQRVYYDKGRLHFDATLRAGDGDLPERAKPIPTIFAAAERKRPATRAQKKARAANLKKAQAALAARAKGKTRLPPGTVRVVVDQPDGTKKTETMTKAKLERLQRLEREGKGKSPKRSAKENPVASEKPPAAPKVKLVKDDLKLWAKGMEFAKKVGPIKNAEKVDELLGPELELEDQEVVLLLPLDVRYELSRGVVEIARGQRAAVNVDLEDIMRPAILAGGQHNIVVHFHPTGDATPSKQDGVLTKQMQKAFELLSSQKFRDHVVMGNGQYHSFYEGKTFKSKRKPQPKQGKKK